MALVKDKLVDIRVDGGATLEATHYGTVGTANNVRQSYQPASASFSALDFTITTPSQSTYVSRRVDVNATIPFSFVAYNWGPTDYVIKPGTDVAIEAFPFNSIINTGMVQINTSNFTTQQQQILPFLKRRLRGKDVRDKLPGIQTQVSQWNTLAKPNVLPFHNGPFDPKTGDEDGVEGAVPCTPNVYGTNLAIGSGAWLVPAATAATLSTPTLPGVVTCYGYINVSEEPLLLEPFDVNDEQPGMVNVNIINVRLNLSTLDDALARPIKFAKPDWIAAYGTSPAAPQMKPRIEYAALKFDPSQPSKLENTTLVLTYLSPPFTAGRPGKSIYPFTHYNPLTTTWRQDVAVPSYGYVSATSSLITLNVCPDALALYFIPELPGTGSGYETNSNNPINGNVAYQAPIAGSGYATEMPLFAPDSISITWNNNASLLNTLSSTELMKITGRNGIPGAQRNRSQDAIVRGQHQPYFCSPGPTSAPWVGTFSANGAVIVPGIDPNATVIFSLIGVPAAVGPGAPAILSPTITINPGAGFTVYGMGAVAAEYRYVVQQPVASFYFNPYLSWISNSDSNLFTTGAPVLLSMSKDLPIEAGVGAGTAGIYTLQVTYNTRNFSNSPITEGKLYVVPIFSQYFTVYAGATSTVETAILDEASFAQMRVSGDSASVQSINGTTPSKDVRIAAGTKQRILRNIANAMRNIAVNMQRDVVTAAPPVMPKRARVAALLESGAAQEGGAAYGT